MNMKIILIVLYAALIVPTFGAIYPPAFTNTGPLVVVEKITTELVTNVVETDNHSGGVNRVDLGSVRYTYTNEFHPATERYIETTVVERQTLDGRFEGQPFQKVNEKVVYHWKETLTNIWVSTSGGNLSPSDRVKLGWYIMITTNQVETNFIMQPMSFGMRSGNNGHD